MEAPYFDFLCTRCHQMSVPGRDVATLPADQPLVCESCRERDREPQGEQDRLFSPAPPVPPGQLEFDRPRLAASYGAVHGLPREPGEDFWGLS